jgi:hypothetical protein
MTSWYIVFLENFVATYIFKRLFAFVDSEETSLFSPKPAIAYYPEAIKSSNYLHSSFSSTHFNPVHIGFMCKYYLPKLDFLGEV